MGEGAPEFALGTVVWAHCEGWPWWPAIIVPYSITAFLPEKGFTPHNDPSKFCVEFFCNGTVSMLSAFDLVRFEEGMHHVEKGGKLDAVIRNAAFGAQRWIQQHCHYVQQPQRDCSGLQRELDEELARLEVEKAAYEGAQNEARGLKMQLFAARERQAKALSLSQSSERPVVDKVVVKEEQNEASGTEMTQVIKEEEISDNDIAESGLELSEHLDEFTAFLDSVQVPKPEDVIDN